MPGASIAIRWVAHPLTIAATILLWLNDHAFKETWPGPVTGKLSDVAGLAAFPALLGLLLAVAVPRTPSAVVAWTSIAVTGAGFAWVKLTDAGAGAASAAWSVVNGSSYVLKDPLDLVALPALGLAWWAWRRARLAPEPGRDAVFRVRLLVALPLGVLSVAGTSAPAEPDAIVNVREEGGRVVVSTQTADLASTTGTDGWTIIDQDIVWRDSPYEESSVYASPTVGGARQMCVPNDPWRCYRIRDGRPTGRWWSERYEAYPMGVEESLDAGATWHTVWSIGEDRWQLLAARHGLYLPRDSTLLASMSLVVRDLPGGSGYQVVVANGVDGLAVRAMDGTWSRIAVQASGRMTAGTYTYGEGEFTLRVKPEPLTGFAMGIGPELQTGLGVGLVAMFAVAGVVSYRLRVTRRGRAVWLPGGVAVVAMATLALVVMCSAASLADRASPVVLMAGMLFGAAAMSVGAVVQREIPRPRALAAVGGGLAVLGAYTAPYFAWTLGVPDRIVTADWWALGASAVALAGAVWIARWAGAKANPLPGLGAGRWMVPMVLMPSDAALRKPAPPPPPPDTPSNPASRWDVPT